MILKIDRVGEIGVGGFDRRIGQACSWSPLRLPVWWLPATGSDAPSVHGLADDTKAQVFMTQNREAKCILRFAKVISPLVRNETPECTKRISNEIVVFQRLAS